MTILDATKRLTPEFLDDAILPPPYTLYRHDGSLGRYYYTLDPEGPSFYPSVTTAIKAVFGEDKYLVEWKIQKGEFEGERIAREKADYGTLMHIEIARMLRNNIVNFDELPTRIEAYTKGLRYTPPYNWHDKLPKHLLSKAQFLRDYNVKVLAVEHPLRSEIWGFASMIDLVCEMDAYKYAPGTPESERKRLRAILDHKSNEEGAVYDNYIMQGFMYQALWEEHYPELPIDLVGNWFPSDWRNEPSYKLVWHNGKHLQLSLEQKIENKQAKIAEHEAKIAEWEAKVAEGKKNVGNIEAKRSEIASLQQQIEQLLNQKQEAPSTSMEEQMPLRLQLIKMAAPKIKPRTLHAFGMHALDDVDPREMYTWMDTGDMLGQAARAHDKNEGSNFRVCNRRTLEVSYYDSLEAAEIAASASSSDILVVEMHMHERWQRYDAQDPAHIAYAMGLDEVDADFDQEEPGDYNHPQDLFS